MPPGRQPGRSGANHQHALTKSAVRPFDIAQDRLVEFPAALDRFISQKTLHRVDADGAIQIVAIAYRFTRVIANPPHDGGKRIVFGERTPGMFIVARFGMIQPALDVLAGRTGGVAGRQAIHINRPLGAPRSGAIGQR
jgi:hypothetical protein